MGAELGRFAGRQDEVVLTEDEAQLTAQHVNPIVTLVRLRRRFGECIGSRDQVLERAAVRRNADKDEFASSATNVVKPAPSEHSTAMGTHTSLDAATAAETETLDERYDVVVVGGGAAGLSAGLALARARRSVLVIDSGTPRNAPADHVHNYLGREGVPPGELLALGRAEVAAYGGQVVSGHVTSAQPIPGGGFRTQLADGRTVTSRRLLVTTGLVDELPDVPGVAERWGRDVLHCPYCHGWEVRDQALGILATNPMAVHQAMLFRQWSADVTLFVHTGPAPPPEQAEQLAARGIPVVEGEVAAVEVTDDQLSGVRLASGELVARQALVVMPRFVARADVLTSLGGGDH